MNLWDLFKKSITQIKNTTPQNIYIGLSGGIDSVVLTHLCIMAYKQGLLPQPKLVHVIHSQSQTNAEMAAWCQSFAMAHKLSCQILDPPSISCTTEQSMRSHRYQRFCEHLKSGTLLLAHHQDDQLETALFHFIRGSGLSGLAGMPQKRTLDKVKLFRPLLNCPKSMILLWANQHNLPHFEDPSNQSTKFSRNFIRHEIMPLIAQHWPDYRARMHHTCQQAKSATASIQKHVQLYLESHASNTWLKLNPHEDKWLLGEIIRTWRQDLALSHSQINTLLYKCQTSAKGVHIIQKHFFYFYSQTIFFFAQPIEPFNIDMGNTMSCFNHDSPLRTTMLQFNGHNSSLKKIYQALRVPSWLRTIIPILHHNGLCIAIPLFYIHTEHRNKQAEIEKQCPLWFKTCMQALR